MTDAPKLAEVVFLYGSCGPEEYNVAGVAESYEVAERLLREWVSLAEQNDVEVYSMSSAPDFLGDPPDYVGQPYMVDERERLLQKASGYDEEGFCRWCGWCGAHRIGPDLCPQYPPNRGFSGAYPPYMKEPVIT